VAEAKKTAKKRNPNRTNKYITNVLPHLDAVAAWARAGVKEEDIATNLGIVYSTFRIYKNKHSELKEALRTNKNIANATVESSFFKSSVGYFITELKGFKCKDVYYDEKGRRCEKEHVELAEETRWIKPDVGAFLAWLFNTMPDKWKNKQVVRAVMTDLAKYLDEVQGEEF
jgi:hypothetical protein